MDKRQRPQRHQDQDKVARIIQEASTTAGLTSAGMSQLAWHGTDLGILDPIAKDMISRIKAAMGKSDVLEPNDQTIHELVSSVIVGRKSALSFIGVIPIVGNVLSGAATAVGISTLGHAVEKALSEGKGIQQLTIQDVRQLKNQRKLTPQ